MTNAAKCHGNKSFEIFNKFTPTAGVKGSRKVNGMYSCLILH